MTAPAGMPLAILEEATRMLSECRTIDEAKKVRDLAEAARVYARKAQLGKEAENYASEIKLRAERRCGEIIIELKRRGEFGAGNPQLSSGTRIGLDDIDLTADESSRYQKLADIDHPHLEKYIDAAKVSGAPITAAGAIRTLSPTEQREREDRAAELFAIYRAMETLATFGMSAKKWAKLDHGASRYRVDQHLEGAIVWLQELEAVWQTT